VHRHGLQQTLVLKGADEAATLIATALRPVISSPRKYSLPALGGKYR